MSDKTKTVLISALNTFIATFVVAVGAVLTSDNVQWTVAFWLPLLTAAARAGVKAVIDKFVPIRLGGKK